MCISPSLQCPICNRKCKLKDVLKLFVSYPWDDSVDDDELEKQKVLLGITRMIYFRFELMWSSLILNDGLFLLVDDSGTQG